MVNRNKTRKAKTKSRINKKRGGNLMKELSKALVPLTLLTGRSLLRTKSVKKTSKNALKSVTDLGKGTLKLGDKLVHNTGNLGKKIVNKATKLGRNLVKGGKTKRK